MSDYFSPLRQEDHLAKYGDNPRTDLLALLQEAPRRVLDIGCGSGAFGVLVKQKFPGVHYVGVELDESAAALARPRLDKVIVADVERTSLEQFDIAKASFDLLVCADVLEHLYDPWKALHALSEHLAPGGKVLASFPNIQNISVIAGLVAGNWTYARFGLLDATHIRFFTLNEIVKLFSGTGFSILQCVATVQDNSVLSQGEWPRDLDFGRLVLKNVTKEEAQRLFTFQYLVLARKQTDKEYPQ